jgi:hypothetical protein
MQNATSLVAPEVNVTNRGHTHMMRNWDLRAAGVSEPMILPALREHGIRVLFEPQPQTFPSAAKFIGNASRGHAPGQAQKPAA